MTYTLQSCLRDHIVEHIKPARGDTRRPGIAGDRLMEFFGAERDAATFTRKDGRDYRAKRLRDGVTDSTIRRELGVLMKALRHAAEEERIKAVPVIKLPPESPPRVRWFTEDEVVKLLEQPMSARARLYIYLALGTGARREAITTVPVKRVDLVNAFIDYRDPKKPVTKKKRVKVKIVGWLLPILTTALAGKKPDDLVIGEGGDVTQEVKKLLRRIGIDEKGISCHAMRRTFVCWSFLNGAKPAEVSAAIGDSMATLERNYFNVFPEHSRGAVEAIKSPERKL